MKPSSVPLPQVAPLVASRVTAAIAIAVITGWVLHIDLLKHFIPGVIGMNVLSASCLLAGSFALRSLTAAEPKAIHLLGARVLAGSLTIVGVLALAMIASGNPSPLLFGVGSGETADGSLVEGNTARTACNLIFMGASLLLLRTKPIRGYHPSVIMSSVTGVLATLSLIAYSHNLIGYYTTSSYVPASLLTSICFLVVATGILLARADYGILAIVVSETAGGMVARRLIPLAILLPILIGAARQAGENAGLFGTAFGAANSATAFTTIFFAAIWWTAHVLFRIDTNRMVAESARQENEQHLHQLNIEKVAAERANKAKDDFLAVLSHELRTPLTPALAAASYLADYANLAPEFREQANTIRANVQLEARLIDDLLDLTRIARGKIELHTEIVDAHHLLRSTLQIVQEDIARKEVELLLNLHAGEHHVWADPVRLQQVFWNLINNAIKFSNRTGHVRIETWNESDRLAVEILNSGIGIEPAQQQRIFSAFEQGERTISRQFGGLGLGLAITKKLLDLHRATISVISQGKDQGAAFKVTLAAIEEPKVTRTARPASTKEGGRSLHLLVVDDHPQTLRVLSGILRREGHQVFTAESLQTAIKLVEAERFDALISDIGLPDGNGCELMRAARARQQLVGIAVSGFGTEEDIRRSMDAGFAHHLTKPIDFQDLNKFVGAIAARN